MPAYAIEDVAAEPEGAPAAFRLVPTGAPLPTADEAALAEAVALLVAELRAAPARDHVKQAEWMALLRGLAQSALVAQGGAPSAAAAGLAALRAEIGRDVARLMGAPFDVWLDHRHVLHIEAREGAGQPSADQAAFLDELHEAEHFVVTLYRPSLGVSAPREEKDIVYARLEGAAALALGRARPVIATARSALRSLIRDAIRDRGPAVREAYLAALFRNYVVVLCAIMAIGFLYDVAVRPERYLNCAEISAQGCWIAPAPLVLPGLKLLLIAVTLVSLAAGAWLSAAQRLDTNSPEVLSSMLSEGDPTRGRAFMVMGFGLIALLLLHTGLVTIAVGTDSATVFTSIQATERFSFAILTGCFLGLGERALPAAVNQRAADFVASLGTPGPRR